MMRTLFYNGNVYIGDNKFAQGFIVDNEKIVKIIDKESNLKEMYDNSVNLNKKTVIPSLIDAHNHFLMTAKNINKYEFDISKIKSKNLLVENIKKFYSKNKHLDFLYFEGLITNNFKTKIDKKILDKISNKLPIMIYTSDRHTAILNSYALSILGLNVKNPISKYGGIIELDENKFPNGIIKENACNYLNLIINSSKSKINTITQMKKLEKKLLEYGIGTIGTCDISEINFKESSNLYKCFNDKKNINIVHQCPIFDLKNVEDFYNNLNNIDIFNNKYQIKVFLDGSLSSSTAAISCNYIDGNSSGHINYDLNYLDSTIKKINDKGISVVVHCIGDVAIDKAINMLDYDHQNNINNGIIHYQLNNRKLDDLISEKNLNVCVQPSFIEDDLNILDKKLNKKIIEESYRYKYLYSKNSNVVSFGTDAPICDYNPWTNIYYALSNKQINGNKSLSESSCFNIFESINCYTKNSAIFLGLKDRGMIQKGYYADFIILEQDIFNLKNTKDILKTKVTSHYINGKRIF